MSKASREAVAAPKVSVIVPVYNMGRYLENCLTALCRQTLDDIEIVCVNDGSTDSSGDILARFAVADDRVRVIAKTNSGYGASMNRGLSEARGEFIGIVEPDDYPDLVMFEKLYRAAVKFGCDAVKCNYYEHYENRENIHWNFRGFAYGVPFDPAEHPEVVCTAPSIWAGLYRRDFLVREGIDFRETPGAAFQDAAFSLKVWYAAESVVLLRRPMLHYRMDNEGSSSKTTDKAFAVCDELASAEAFLRERPDRHDAFIGWHNVGKWEKYRWNYARVEPGLHRELAERMRCEFEDSQRAGELDLGLFDVTSRFQLEELLDGGAVAFAEGYPQGYPAHWEAQDSGEVPEDGLNRPVVVPEGPSPAVTVVVPIYNCEPYVAECVESLKRQSFGDFEAFLVDDASTDGSLVAARAAAGDDARFTLLPQKQNKGLSAVRNIALDRAQGEYVVFLDSDDYLAVDALAKLVARARRQRLDDLYFSGRSFHESLSSVGQMSEEFGNRPSFEGVATGRALFVFFEQHDQFFTQAALRMVRRQFLEDNGIRFVEGILHEDILFTFQTLVASQRSSFLNEPLYQRRLREGSIIGSSWTTRHVHGHFHSMQEIKKWLHANADDVDDSFLWAIGRQMGLWREVCAHRWATDIDEADRASYLASLAPGDRVDFFNDIVGSGGAADRVRDEYRGSVTYRVGDALLGVPRFVRDRARALVEGGRAHRENR